MPLAGEWVQRRGIAPAHHLTDTSSDLRLEAVNRGGEGKDQAASQLPATGSLGRWMQCEGLEQTQDVTHDRQLGVEHTPDRQGQLTQHRNTQDRQVTQERNTREGVFTFGSAPDPEAVQSQTQDDATTQGSPAPPPETGPVEPGAAEAAVKKRRASPNTRDRGGQVRKRARDQRQEGSRQRAGAALSTLLSAAAEGLEPCNLESSALTPSAPFTTTIWTGLTTNTHSARLTSLLQRRAALGGQTRVRVVGIGAAGTAGVEVRSEESLPPLWCPNRATAERAAAGIALMRLNAAVSDDSVVSLSEQNGALRLLLRCAMNGSLDAQSVLSAVHAAGELTLRKAPSTPGCGAVVCEACTTAAGIACDPEQPVEVRGLAAGLVARLLNEERLRGVLEPGAVAVAETATSAMAEWIRSEEDDPASSVLSHQLQVLEHAAAAVVAVSVSCTKKDNTRRTFGICPLEKRCDVNDRAHAWARSLRSELGDPCLRMLASSLPWPAECVPRVGIESPNQPGGDWGWVRGTHLPKECLPHSSPRLLISQGVYRIVSMVKSARVGDSAPNS
eukprot:Hpha_TRINITY_DN11037_c0_g1::TRINITY_DN11037_c0_g1_i1::g.92950::m.92950